MNDLVTPAQVQNALETIEEGGNKPPYASIKYAPSFKLSPYKPEQIHERTRKLQGKPFEEVTTSTGEVRKLYEVDKIVTGKRDELNYVKVFKPELLQMGELSVPGLKLLCYIMYQLKVNGNEIVLDAEDFLEKAGYSSVKNKKNQRNRVQYYKGVLDLLNHNFMVRKSGCEATFYINVNRFFNGDRLVLAA